MSQVKVIGAGLAGSEAAWQLAQRGIQVTLYEMRPVKSSPAHHTDSFAELVCSVFENQSMVIDIWKDTDKIVED